MSSAFRHPLATHAAGTVLGYRRDGRPIYAIAGGDGTGEGGGQGTPGAPAGQPGEQAPTPTAPKPTAQTPTAQPAADGDITSLPPWAQDTIKAARAEAGKARTQAKENAATEARNQLAQDIGRALGLVKGDTAPTPDELTMQLRESQSTLTQAQERAASAEIELHVYRRASRMGVDADALLDSRAFCEAVDAIDSSANAQAFDAAVEQAISKAVTDNPRFAVRSGPTRGGAEFGGAPTSERKPTNLNDAIAARMGG